MGGARGVFDWPEISYYWEVRVVRPNFNILISALVEIWIKGSSRSWSNSYFGTETISCQRGAIFNRILKVNILLSPGISLNILIWKMLKNNLSYVSKYYNLIILCPKSRTIQFYTSAQLNWALLYLNTYRRYILRLDLNIPSTKRLVS